jgi:YD repeat-containing protein
VPSKTLIIKVIGISFAANLLFALPHATATVDMKNGNYNDTWIDMLLPSSGFALQVTRTYNSRSNFIGLFGHGWCTDFETVLHVLPEGQIEVVECGAGQGTVFKPAKFNSAILQKTVDKIVADYAKANPDSTKESLRLLRSDLATSSSVRAEWAQSLNIQPPTVSKGSRFNSESDETITFDGSSYTLRLTNGSLQKFDRIGKLIALFDRNGNFLKLQYNPRGLLSAVSDNLSRRVVFNLTPSGYVYELVGPSNTRAEFKYHNDDLAEVQNMWHNTYGYQYSDSHNLVRINPPDKRSKEITYDEKNDRVLMVKTDGPNANRCVESFSYENNAKQTSDYSYVTSTHKCGSQAPSESKAEFWHAARPNGSRYLSRIVTKTGKELTDVTYHPELGQPTQVRHNSDITTFAYYNNGLLKERATKFERQSYQYDLTSKKVVRVVRSTTNEKGHTVWKRETLFKYDDKGNMIAALGSDGTNFEVRYDKRGRIVSIHAKPKVSLMISYDENLGKPNLITHPDLGSLRVTYSPSGDVDKLESKQGSRVKIQIASTFNNFLETISPATSAISL